MTHSSTGHQRHRSDSSSRPLRPARAQAGGGHTRGCACRGRAFRCSRHPAGPASAAAAGRHPPARRPGGLGGAGAGRCPRGAARRRRRRQARPQPSRGHPRRRAHARGRREVAVSGPAPASPAAPPGPCPAPAVRPRGELRGRLVRPAAFPPAPQRAWVQPARAGPPGRGLSRRRKAAPPRADQAATGNVGRPSRPARPPAPSPRPRSPAPRWWLLPRFLGLGMVAAALGSAPAAPLRVSVSLLPPARESATISRWKSRTAFYSNASARPISRSGAAEVIGESRRRTNRRRRQKSPWRPVSGVDASFSSQTPGTKGAEGAPAPLL